MRQCCCLQIHFSGTSSSSCNGVYRITGPKVTLVGGRRRRRAEVRSERSSFTMTAVVEEGAVALWIASEQPLHVVTRHGWEPIGVPMLVTRAEGTEILETRRPAGGDSL